MQCVKIICLFFLFYPFITVSAQPIINEEFTLRSPGGFELSGQLDYPSSGKKLPAAILIWGNGPHTRDQEISKSPVFKQIADYLCSKGMAVLRMDKRGFGKSTGKFSSEGNYTTRDLVNDVKLAYRFLNKHARIDTTKVGLIGHSEGCIIASMLAAEEPDIDWIIAYGVPAVRGDSIIAEQTRLNRQRLGINKETSDAIAKVWGNYFQYLESGNTNDSVYYAIGRDFLIAHGLDKDDQRITPAFINQLLSGYKTEWNRYFMKTDAGEFYKKLHLPLLAVFGGEDKQTSVEQNLVPLHLALSQAGHKNYHIVVLSDEDHFFLRYQDQRIEKHQPGLMQVSKKFLRTVNDWLVSQNIISR